MPTLMALLDAGHEIVLVVTQPDRPSGRGRRLTPSPVKVAAVESGLPVLQHEDVNAFESLALVRLVKPDAMVVQAFGQKLSPGLLSLPECGCFNLHASLLPAYRGAAPINWAVINGERETGVTVMRMNERIDAGEMLAREAVAIEPAWTAGDLAGVLSGMGAGLMVRTLAEVESGTARPVSQDPSKVSRAPRLTKRDGLIPWRKSARDVHNHVRGMTPWPGAFSFLGDARAGRSVRLTALRSCVAAEAGSEGGAAGEVLSVGKEGLLVCCGEGSVRIERLKPAGSREMSATEFASGHALVPGMGFTDHE